MCSQYSCPRRQGFCSSARVGCYQRLTRWVVSVLFYVRFFRYSWGYTLLQKKGQNRRTLLCVFFFLLLCEASVQFSSVTQLCPILCDPMDCSMPGFPAHHQLPELVQTHIHRVGDACNHLILCHPLLLLPSIFPSIRVFSNESVLCIR